MNTKKYGRKVRKMSKFDDCTKTVSRVAKKAAEGAVKLTDCAATTVKIKVEEGKLKNEYAELGKLSLEYFAHADVDNVPESIAEAIDAVKAQKKVVKNLKKQENKS